MMNYAMLCEFYWGLGSHSWVEISGLGELSVLWPSHCWPSSQKVTVLSCALQPSFLSLLFSIQECLIFCTMPCPLCTVHPYFCFWPLNCLGLKWCSRVICFLQLFLSPSKLSYYESAGGLIHWLGLSPQGLVVCKHLTRIPSGEFYSSPGYFPSQSSWKS